MSADPARDELDVVMSIENVKLPVNGVVIDIPDLKVAKGSLYHLYGRGDSGATEFLMVIAGLGRAILSSDPAPAGELRRVQGELASEQLERIQIHGESVYDMAPADRARRIGVIFDNPEWSLLGGVVIEEFWYSFAASREPRPPMDSLRKYGLLEQRHQRTETLSGGEMQRLNCASVLEGRRDVIVADFSSSNLDKDFLQDLLSWISYRAACGTAVILHGLSPDQLPAEAVSIVIENGAIVNKAIDPSEFPSEVAQATILQAQLERAQSESSNLQIVLRSDAVWGEHSRAGFSCELSSGEIVVVEGANGSGKTTIGRMFAERGKPVSGTFDLCGSRPAIAFQHPEHCFFANSVWGELPDKRVLTLCQIEEHLWREHPRNLSKTQQKLLSVAAAISLSKGFAILDEPTCGMDFAGKKIFINLLNNANHLAFLIITHDGALSGIGTRMLFSSSE